MASSVNERARQETAKFARDKADRLKNKDTLADAFEQLAGHIEGLTDMAYATSPTAVLPTDERLLVPGANGVLDIATTASEWTIVDDDPAGSTIANSGTGVQLTAASGRDNIFGRVLGITTNLSWRFKMTLSSTDAFIVFDVKDTSGTPYYIPFADRAMLPFLPQILNIDLTNGGTIAVDLTERLQTLHGVQLASIDRVRIRGSAIVTEMAHTNMTAATPIVTGDDESPITPPVDEPATGSGMPESALVFWVEADTGVTTSGAAVTGWADQSASGNDLVALGAPTLTANHLNSLPAIEFDGVDDVLQTSGNVVDFPLGSADRAMYLLARYRATNESGGVGYGADSDNNLFGLSVHAPSGGALRVNGWGGANDFVSNRIGAGLGWIIQSAQVESNQLTHRVGDTVIDTQSHTYNTAAGTLVLGADHDLSPILFMDIAAMLVFDRALTSDEHQSVLAYLSDKYFGDTPDTGPPTPPIDPPASGDFAFERFTAGAVPQAARDEWKHQPLPGTFFDGRATVNVSGVSALNAALADTANRGKTIVLSAGSYNGVIGTVSGGGTDFTPGNRMYIDARGSNLSNADWRAPYCTIVGANYLNRMYPNAAGLRICYSTFTTYGKVSMDGKLVGILHDDLEIDNCEFHNIHPVACIEFAHPTASANALGYATTRRPWIHHCTFRDMPQSVPGEDRPPDEVIQSLNAWTPHYADGYTYAVIENCTFSRCLGDQELMTCKSPKWMIRNNLFEDNGNHVVTFRSTYGCIMYGNIIVGGAGHTIRMFGNDNWVMYNLVLGSGFSGPTFSARMGPWTSQPNIVDYYIGSDGTICRRNVFQDCDNWVRVLDLYEAARYYANTPAGVEHNNNLFLQTEQPTYVAAQKTGATYPVNVTEGVWTANNPNSLLSDQIISLAAGGGTYRTAASETWNWDPVTATGVWHASHRANPSVDVVIAPHAHVLAMSNFS